MFGDAGRGDLATDEGVDELYRHIQAAGRPVDVLMANAGVGLGHAFLAQDEADWRRVVDTNITGTLLLIQRIGRDMQARGEGRILVTGSIAGFMPGTFQAVYNGGRACAAEAGKENSARMSSSCSAHRRGRLTRRCGRCSPESRARAT